MVAWIISYQGEDGKQYSTYIEETEDMNMTVGELIRSLDPQPAEVKD